jgi:hypothetical protein
MSCLQSKLDLCVMEHASFYIVTGTPAYPQDAHMPAIRDATCPSLPRLSNWRVLQVMAAAWRNFAIFNKATLLVLRLAVAQRQLTLVRVASRGTVAWPSRSAPQSNTRLGPERKRSPSSIRHLVAS